ncbi:uncharacterized protein LOC131842538 [Achroia grisella]|uniref:uncharacterized protein LOC131842538 n=1 Tax=Achroia grisella TaxID=688607 RepID=UPI0027D1F4B1|nr:uncharacterized protein LOC131842538 [Achroia grisella]
MWVSKMFTVYIFIVLFLMNVADAIKAHCSQEEDLLKRCSVSLPVLSSPEISFALTQEELDKSCVELRAGIKCIDNYTEVCMEKHEQIVFRKIYAGITDVVQELCTRGKYQEEYLKHANCVKNVRPEYEKCSHKYEVTLTGLSELSNHQVNEQYKTDRREALALGNREDYLRIVCCSFQEYLKCSELTVQSSCGDEAALFTSAFLKRMASNIIKNYCLEFRGAECNSGSRASDHKVITISIAILANLAVAYLSKLLVPT